MPMDRTPISEFRKMTLNPQWPTDGETATHGFAANTLAFRNLETGEIVAIMNVEDLFDIDGNRFYLDA